MLIVTVIKNKALRLEIVKDGKHVGFVYCHRHKGNFRIGMEFDREYDIDRDIIGIDNEQIQGSSKLIKEQFADRANEISEDN